jgi:heme exporter protein D
MNGVSWDAFWAMGGYGLYVWGSYGVVAIALVLEVWQARSAKRQVVQMLKDELGDNLAP